MTQTEMAIRTVLVNEEKELRQRMNELAEKYDYRGITFSNEDDDATVGESLQRGLNSRWLNIVRLISVGDFSIGWIARELDMDTLAKVHRAMP